MAITVGQKVRHPTKPEWGIGEVLKVEDQKVLVQFEEVGPKLLKNVALIVLEYQQPLLQSEDTSHLRDISPIRSSKKERGGRKHRSKATRKVKRTLKKTSTPKDVAEHQRSSIIGLGSRDLSITQESETILKILDRLRDDLGSTSEANTALLLYTLLQTPGTLAHSYLGTLDSELRAHLVVEALQGAQGKQFGIPNRPYHLCGTQDSQRYLQRLSH
jgi:Protein of unknown function (DUF3553)